MFELIVVYPLALYGLWVLLGAPATDRITGLGKKLLDWARAKVNDQ